VVMYRHVADFRCQCHDEWGSTESTSAGSGATDLFTKAGVLEVGADDVFDLAYTIACLAQVWCQLHRRLRPQTSCNMCETPMTSSGDLVILACHDSNLASTCRPM
jgi:hypothetical protein